MCLNKLPLRKYRFFSPLCPLTFLNYKALLNQLKLKINTNLETRSMLQFVCQALPAARSPQLCQLSPACGAQWPWCKAGTCNKNKHMESCQLGQAPLFIAGAKCGELERHEEGSGVKRWG